MIKKFITKSKILSFPRMLIGLSIQNLISMKNGVIVFYDNEHINNLIKQIKIEVHFLLGDSEAHQIYMAVKNTGKIVGDIAEVGCYSGGSSKLICEAKGNKSFYVFDTFEGLPKLTKNDTSKDFEEGSFFADFDRVKWYLSNYSNVHIYKGLFPSTSKPIEDKRFSFVHLDVDLYESTLDCLKFFYPRMNKGGVLISHDYAQLSGVRKAFDEFFKDKQEPIIEMSGTQCLIVKL